jgi:hypothetical protein
MLPDRREFRRARNIVPTDNFSHEGAAITADQNTLGIGSHPPAALAAPGGLRIDPVKGRVAFGGTAGGPHVGREVYNSSL